MFYIFSGCSNLKSLTLGYNVNFIGKEAFSDCRNLEDVYCYAEEAPSTNDRGEYHEAFNNSLIEYATLHVATTSLDKYKKEKPWSRFGTIVAFEPAVYTLTYKVNGEVYKVVEIESGNTIDLEMEPIKEGCMFSGWSDVPTTMPEHNVTVTGYLFTPLDTEKTYTFQHGGAYLYISATCANYTTEPNKLRFEDAGDGKYYITNGMFFIGQTYNIWSFPPVGLTSTPDKNEALTIAISGRVIDDTTYYILISSMGQLGGYYSYSEGMGDLRFTEEESVWILTEVEPDSVDAIDDIIADDGTYKIFTLDGKSVETLQKEVNIIRFFYGTTKSVYVK